MQEYQTVVQKRENMTNYRIHQGFAVTLLANGGIALCAADTDVFYGVALENIRDGDSGNVGVIGTYKCFAGAAVTSGQRVGPGTAGKFFPVTRDGATVAGVAEEGVAVDAVDHLFQVTLGVGITLSVPNAMMRKGRRSRSRK